MQMLAHLSLNHSAKRMEDGVREWERTTVNVREVDLDWERCEWEEKSTE